MTEFLKNVSIEKILEQGNETISCDSVVCLICRNCPVENMFSRHVLMLKSLSIYSYPITVTQKINCIIAFCYLISWVDSDNKRYHISIDLVHCLSRSVKHHTC